MDGIKEGLKLKFEDTNIALLGTIFEKKLRLERAEAEPEWKKIKKEPGLMIWRIEKFNVVPWPKEQYGTFYQGDSYIILNITQPTDHLEFRAHMWVGKESTCDETGTAAYKIVELDAETFKLSETDKSLTVILFRSKLLPLKVIELLTVKSSNDPEFDLIESETFKSPEVKVNLLLIFKLPEKSKDIILDFTVSSTSMQSNVPFLSVIIHSRATHLFSILYLELSGNPNSDFTISIA